VQQQEDNTASRLAPQAPADTCPAHSPAPDVPSAPRQERASADMHPAPDAPAHILPGANSPPSTAQDDSNPPSVVPAAVESAPVLHPTPDVSSSAPGVSPERCPVHDVPGPSSTASAQPRQQPSASSPEVLPHRTRLQGGIRKPKVFTDETVRYGNLAVLSEPYNLQEALSVPQWKQAMHDEYSALLRNKTWHLVPPQPGRNVIDCK
jgi:hypothetical protein